MHKAVFYARLGLIIAVLSLCSGMSWAYPQHTPNWTPVEKAFIDDSGRQAVYPHEYIAVIEARDHYELGKMTALRFIEWVKDHPRGVISLTSGTTPEYFVKFLDYYKKNWHKPKVQAELRRFGINLKNFPDTSNLRFVQLEEFYPLSPKHNQKVSNFVTRHYLKFLNLKTENVLLMDLANKGILAEKGMKVVFMNGRIDLSIMDHKPNTQLESWQQQAIRELRTFCIDYENKIREWGGIDFFLGGISYGGHLGFNRPGTSLDSKTHLVNLDYNTAAHAAKDLGGIEHARGKIAITIGLGTITINPKAVLIMIASGEAKAAVVRDALETPANIKHPSSLLQKFPNSRFYITSGAGKLLDDRRTEDIKIESRHGWTQKIIEDVIIEVAQKRNKAITSLTREDLELYERGRLLLQNPPKPLNAMLNDVRGSLISHLESGLKLNSLKSSRILHTGPHHDDIMLGYYPLIENLVCKHKNHFVYFTSGFNSVSDLYIMSTINRASDWWINKEKDSIFNRPYDKVVNKFRKYFVRQDIDQMNMLDTTILLKKLVTIYNIKDVEQLKNTIRWLKDDYFPNKQAGDMDDVENIKLLKGMMRESEADRLWSLKNVQLQNITHLRLKFYSGKELRKTPRIETDVLPFAKVYENYKPSIITVADDPQSAPPTTHYSTLQILAQALRYKNVTKKEDLQIWGYRNVWFRYRVQDANVFVPVTEQMIEAQKRAFLACFSTQKMASFPSPFFEGDFSALTTLIQREQLAELKVLLGADYFEKNPIPELKNAYGLIFLNKMNIDELYQRAEDLHKAIELEQIFETKTT